MEMKLQKHIWTFETSIFRDYARDNEAINKNCFETDWNNSKLPKILRLGEVNKVKEILRAKYAKIRSCYKYLSSV